MALAEDNIIGIYHYFAPTQGGAAYYLLYVFDHQGLLDRETLHKTYTDMFFSSQRKMDARYVGPFEGLENVHQYVLRLCGQQDVAHAHLFAAADFNQFLENTTTADDLGVLLSTQGHQLDNLEKLKRKKGLLGKIFS